MAAERVGTGRGPYAKSARQRERIIATALEYFGQQGYHGTSMREIARETGLSQAGLLHHFPSKADLLIAVLVGYYVGVRKRYPSLPSFSLAEGWWRWIPIALGSIFALFVIVEVLMHTS